MAESFGVAATKIGGRESLGPPTGGMILAQELENNQPPIRGRRKIKIQTEPAGSNFFMQHKGSGKSNYAGS